MPDNSFPVGYPPDAVHGLKGSTLNKLGNTLNALSGHGVQHGAVSINGVTKASIPAPEFIFGMAKIIGASDLCATDTTEPDSRGFPCRTSNKYVVNFRHWDHDQGDFVVYEQNWEMDAGGYWESGDTEASKAPTSGVGYGPIPVYAVGDVVPAYLDRHRGKIIPVHSPYCDSPSAVFQTRGQQTIPILPLIGPTAHFVLEMLRPGINQNQWQGVATIAFPLAYPDLGTETLDSSTTFNTVPCPHGTLFRVRQYRGSDASEGSDIVVTSVIERLRFIGAGRRSPLVIAAAAVDAASAGIGDYQRGWLIDASTINRYKDAPYFAVPSGDSSAEQIQATYFDTKDEWMVSVELFVKIHIAIDEFSTSSSRSSLSSSSSSSSTSSLSSSSSSSSSTSSLSSSSSTSTLSSSSSSHSRSSSSTSASISTSSSSQSRSTSSSSGYDCIKVPECYEFNATTCVMTITWAELCFPRGVMTVTHDVEPPC